MDDWKAFIGKRVIVQRNSYGCPLVEIMVMEVSPSEERVKFKEQDSIGRDSIGRWHDKHDYRIIESLSETEAVKLIATLQGEIQLLKIRAGIQ